ncbi:hypothetical protein SprV_0100124100 [Sparganum proliferum]
MSFAFFRRAFGLKKSPEEQQNEEFLKNFHLEVPINVSFLSKSFRKNALRLLVVRNVSESIVYDSLLNKGNEKVTLHEAAFGACPLSRDRELKFSMKLHDFKSSRELLITCVHTPSVKRVRCTNSASYTKKPNNLESTASSRSSATYLSVMLEALAESIVSILESTTGFTTRSHDGSLLRASYESHTEAHDHINRAFTDFQMAFRDLCIPKLTRPVWSTLTLASLAEQDELNSSESYPETMPGVRSWVNQLPPFGIDLTDSGPTVNVAENLTQSFVRGCLCLQISKAVARDRGFFLGQVLTGLLMHYQGWIPTVQPKEQGPFSFQRNTCEAVGAYGFPLIAA